MEKLILKSELRSNDESLKSLRASKIIPAVVYGHKQEPINIKLDNSDFLRTYRVTGSNHVISLEVDGKKLDVLVHEVQREPVSGGFLHIDFYAITKGEKVHTEIPLNFVGSSKAASEGAIIEELIKELEVKCLPGDLVDNFEVDLSLLAEIGDSIKVSDLKISSKFEVLNGLDEVIVVASKPKVEKIEDSAPTDALPQDPKEENK